MLLPQHQAVLDASGISEEVAGKRSYFSATTKVALSSLGFGRSQLSVPALVIPLFDVTGECFGYQARPDEPRQVKGKTVKYETPTKQPNRIDVSPHCLEQVGDPAIPIVITEGSRKADGAASRGMCCVSLNGVYGWRGTNGSGGKTVLPDFGLIALNSRKVVLCFDSDAMAKKEVHQALFGLAAVLELRHAQVVFAYLPSQPSGAKTGLDDWLAEDASRGYAELEALCRPTLDDLEPQAKEDTFDDVPEEPGSMLLADVQRELRRYLVLGHPEYETALTLWIAHTHCFDANEVSPNLYVHSPMKSSGKTRTLEVCELLVRRPRRAVNMSLAALFRMIEASQPCILLDEVDRFIGGRPDDRKQEMVGLLDASFRKGDTVLRVVGEGNEMEVKEFILFTPLAMAGLNSLPDTLLHRSVVLTLQRKAPGTTVAGFRRSEAVTTLRPLQRRLAAWGKRNSERLSEHRPAIPESVTDRAADKWEPLLSIAELVGGSWPELATKAAVRFTLEEIKEDEESTLTLRLLLDLADVWPPGRTEWNSSDVVAALKLITDAPWIELGRNKKGLSVRRLAGMLRPFEVVPYRHPDHRGPMHYRASDLVVTWRQYGVPVPDWCASQVPDPPESAPNPAHPAHTPSEQGEQCAGSADVDPAQSCANPAQPPPEPDAQDVRSFAQDEETPFLRNETAGQDPSAQDAQDWEPKTGSGEPDLSLDDVLKPLRGKRRKS
jgi:hypothetical protein